jgi:xanthine dehydrogenase accessory factor
VKHWQETTQVVDRVLRLAEAGRKAAVALVTRIDGSAYRRPGAKLLIEDDGRTAGSVSGGCLEADVREVALGVLRSGHPRLLHYETGADDRVWGLGLGCNGSVDVFVQSASTPEALGRGERIARLLQGDAAFAVATRLDGPAAGVTAVVEGQGPTPEGVDAALADVARRRLLARASGVERAGESDAFTEVLLPPPYLLVCGAGDDAIPLASIATGVGFRVVVVDHRPAFLEAARFPDAVGRRALRPEADLSELPLGGQTFAVVKTHSLAHDREWTRRLLATPVPYVGLLGPAVRCQRIRDEIGAGGEDRLFGPVGLDLGAEGPEQVGLSVVAEVLAVWSRRQPHHLRDREAAIHAAR